MSVLYVDNLQPNLGSRVMAAGHVVQVVQAVSTTSESTTNTSYVQSNLAATITPTSASSKVLVVCTFEGQINTASLTGYFTIYRGASNLADGTGGQFIRLESVGGTWFGAQTISWLDSPSTTSSTEYSLYYKSQTSSLTTSLGLSSCPSVMTLMEIAQ